jgi:hypothetical protein
MSMIKWGAKPEPQRPTLSEAMRNAEPRRPATEVMFAALEKALNQFEHREGVLEREIAERRAELADVQVAKAAATAGMAGLNTAAGSSALTERLAASVSAAVDETSPA